MGFGDLGKVDVFAADAEGVGVVDDDGVAVTEPDGNGRHGDDGVGFGFDAALMTFMQVTVAVAPVARL